MRDELMQELYNGYKTAYIDGSVASNISYRPQFVSNNHKEGRKVLSCIEDELLSCDKFQVSVAFITMGGIEPLLQTSVFTQKDIFSKRKKYTASS